MGATNDNVEMPQENGQVHNGGSHTPPEGVNRRDGSLVFGVKDATKISRIFTKFEGHQVSIQHVETREAKKPGVALDFFVTFEGESDDVTNLVQSLAGSDVISDVNMVGEADSNGEQEVFIPYHISDLDKCQHLLIKFDPDLAQGHPGFDDMAYRARRAEIAQQALEYKHGDPIKRVEYTPEENKTWGTAYLMLSSLYPKYACNQHHKIFKQMEKECGYSENSIPQLEDVSNFLKKRTGFQLRPAAGLSTARDFLASLAHRVHQSTQYIRHSSRPEYNVEPDIIHELIGHVPMLTDPVFADFVQEIGLASIGLPDAEVDKLLTLYWFTVEFGLCKQDGQVKAYGAGLLSSYGELLHAISDKPEKKLFEPFEAAIQEYDDQDYQNTYFIAENFEDMKEKVREYGASHKRPFEIRYNALTRTIERLDKREAILNIITSFQKDMENIKTVVKKVENLSK